MMNTNSSPLTNKRKDRASLIYYLILVLLFIVSLWVSGGYASTHPSRGAWEVAPQMSAFKAFSHSVSEHISSTIGVLLLQLIVILIVVRLVGWIFKRLKQPTVIGEILAGIILGPSFLGWIYPQGMSWLFPESSLGNIELLSQFGLILFMFTIGMELRITDIKQQFRSSMIISQSGIFIPFMLGLAVTPFIYSTYGADRPYLPLALFIGIAMSITAFPVLARIIQERSMGRTHLGKLALSSAAAGDIVAWLMLAAVMAIAQSGSYTAALFNMLFLAIYLVFIFYVLHPLFSVIGRLYNNHEVINRSIIGLIFILLLLSAYLTEILSMHALFGAFMLGLIMPEDMKFRSVINEKVEDISLTLFLPLFFVSSGLRTELGLINSGELWLLFFGILFIAIIGKVGGTYVAARFCNISKRESLYLGAYMNTRGLMELVVLRIGLDLGVLPPVIFAILVLMTLVTTVMTTPLIQIIDFFDKKISSRRQFAMAQSIKEIYKVIISFGRSDTGVLLMKLSKQLFGSPDKRLRSTLMHVTMQTDVNPINAESFYKESFTPAISEGGKLGIETDTLYRISDQPSQEIIRATNRGGYRFLLVGAGLQLSGRTSDRELYSDHSLLKKRWGKISISSPEALLSARNMFKDKTAQFVEETRCNVGIFVNRSFSVAKKIILPVLTEKDLDLIPLAMNLAKNNQGMLSLQPLLRNAERSLYLCEQFVGDDDSIKVLPPAKLPAVLNRFDFLMVGYDTWNMILDYHLEDLDYLPSTLIVCLREEASRKEPSN